MFIHFDEARITAEQLVRGWLEGMPEVTRALLIGDLFGKLRLLIWNDADVNTEKLESELSSACGAWWDGPVVSVKDVDDVSQGVYLDAWRHAANGDGRLAVADRHRNRTGWFVDVPEPLWAAGREPPLIVFYSFKGGMGRSTALASFAIQRAGAGERVCVVDFDLDSPGVGLLLNHGNGVTARWGVVDYLLEHRADDLPLEDYFHRCDRVAGLGEIIVFPSGLVDEAYVHKLARVDLEETPVSGHSGINALFNAIRTKLNPAWILVDARTGVSEVAGYLLSGIAHLHVLLGTEQDQSWRGINLVLDRLGKHRVQNRRSQSEVLLIHAMVPSGEAGRIGIRNFEARAEIEFTSRYYAEVAEDSDSDTYWDISDIDSSDAPHVPVPVEYENRLAAFPDVADVADALSSGAYASIAERIASRFTREEE
jgi:hypothetical protein